MAGFAIAPPLIILIVIIAAIVSVVIAASLYRICRTLRSITDEEEESRYLNPNKRSPEQLQHMEEVRWINNIYAWEQAKSARADDIDERYRLGGSRRRFEEHRARNRVSWTHANFSDDGLFAGASWCDVFEISAEDSSDADHLHGNPYRDMLQQRLIERNEVQARRARLIPEVLSSHTSLPRSEFAREASLQAPAAQNEIVLPQIPLRQAPVTITLNDDPEDIADKSFTDMQYQHPCPAQMPRSSSIYSGDILSPSLYRGSAENDPNSSSQPLTVDVSAMHPIIEQ